MKELVISLLACRGQLTELVTTPLIYGVNSSLSTLKPSLLQDFMRLILLVMDVGPLLLVESICFTNSAKDLFKKD